ncbi:phytoene desaturase [Saliterribacillus persicus]|uniref:Phytoene desaturase n=1 Tax=Saliterribacillus persicus TaxID=930114 RepID=A0A368XYH4_9BACI|nr:phytoene desaturase family protein [Saliterribacillus persicus]RCW73140.1 phytoene desaturase [Saliterribacillus persicus]
MTKAIVIGAGPGGLAAAMQLSAAGYEVEVFEKQSIVGGRTSRLTIGEYAFDLGPTFFMMPQVLEEVFTRVDRNLHDYVEMKEIDPLYTLKFGDKIFTPSRDHQKTREQIKHDFPGNEEGYDRFLRIEGEKYDRVIKLLKQPFSSIGDFFTKDMWHALPKLNAMDTVYGRLSKYFDDERLKWAFSFQAKYLGMSPWDCPGTFTILSFLEHRYGLFHPIGGVNQICEAMAEVIKEYGGKIHLNTEVKQILVKDKKAYGVELADGTVHYADDVVINADFGYAMTKLVDQKHLTKYKENKLNEKKVSCSTFMVYLGLKDKLDLPHHMVLFSEDYKNNVREITEELVLSEDPSMYVHNPSVIDPTLAPEGKSALYLLMPVPNLEADIDWNEMSEDVKNWMIDRVAKEVGRSDLKELIEEQYIVTPQDWQDKYNVYKGATFNLAHSLDQMMYFRPHNKFEEIEHCFLVGGGTHPGSGLPTIFQSAMISTDLLKEQYKSKTSQAKSYKKGYAQ